jgi:diadenosine tetraphosphate (Ap4A) HIT family hydrolase
VQFEKNMNSEKLKNDIELHCRFCNPPDLDRIIYETSNFYVMLSLGPIVEGYLLICSKEHFDCCGKIDTNLGSEFDNLTEIVRKVLITAYGHCLFYEHGRAGSCMTFSEGSKHCYHAHMHCVPVKTKLNSLMDKNFYPIKHDSWNDFRKSNSEFNEPYLFVDDGEKTSHLVVKKDIRRQYLRHLTAVSIGNEELWNWVDNQRLEVIKAGKTKLKPLFDSLQ